MGSTWCQWKVQMWFEYFSVSISKWYLYDQMMFGWMRNRYSIYTHEDTKKKRMNEKSVVIGTRYTPMELQKLKKKAVIPRGNDW